MNRLRYVRLTVAQVAARLGMSARAARKLILKGPLDGIRSGGRIVVELGALEKFQERAA